MEYFSYVIFLHLFESTYSWRVCYLSTQVQGSDNKTPYKIYEELSRAVLYKCSYFFLQQNDIAEKWNKT